MAEPRPVYIPRIFRRVYQGFFLLLFLASLALMTEEGIRRFPVKLLLELDPLSALAVLASSWVLPAGLAVALAVVALTVLFGRAFCGWVCPVGTLHHIASWLTRRLKGGPYNRVNRWRPHFRLKYLLLVGLLVAALTGTLSIGLLDPLSLAMRSFASALLPALASVAAADGQRPRTFEGAWLTGVIFLVLLAANRWIARWWCRALCPLGALLGLAARAAVFRIHVDPELCNDCHRCVRDCQGADEPFDRHRVSECHVCLNCVSVCPEDAIAFRAFAPAASPNGGVDLPRRQLVGAALAGAALLPLLRASSAEAAPEAIRPPGALPEDAFLARCVRCGACVNACPTSALQPSLVTAGLAGLYTPVLVARRGWCEPSCTRCGQVCPTGAITPLTPETKGWTRGSNGAPVRIGTAFFDWGRCLPWAMAVPCVVCEEVCPTSPKAIWLEPADAARADGRVVRVQRPRLDPERCVGCGLCEAKCPVAFPAAIRITRAGESRDPRGGFTLRNVVPRETDLVPGRSPERGHAAITRRGSAGPVDPSSPGQSGLVGMTRRHR
jgi:MauM/NapG family ferredoxin protein